jgi:hypothetical protein
MPQYTQAKLDETIALLVTQGYQIETSWRQGQQLVKISSGTHPKLESVPISASCDWRQLAHRVV